MNLENLNLVELNAREVQETEGGNRWSIMAAIAFIDFVNDFIEGFEEGYCNRTNNCQQ